MSKNNILDDALIHTLQNNHKKGRLAQTLLFTYAGFVKRAHDLKFLVSMILCRDMHTKPCGTCAECSRVQDDCHPDWIDIEPENNLIKLDRVRAVQASVVMMPKRASSIVVSISGLEYLNESASNALLKILEEPPSHVYFILWAKDINLVIPTLLSRCQIYVLPFEIPREYSEILNLFEPTDPRRELLEKLPEICLTLDAIILGDALPQTLNPFFSSYPLQDSLWLMSWLISKLISYKLTHERPSLDEFKKIAEGVSIFNLYACLDEITKQVNLLQNNINLNPALSIDAIGFTLKPA